MIKRYTKNDLNELALILKNDGVISVPTDTIYGVCSRISSKEAFNKLIEVKKRPINKLFPIMCANIDQIKEICIVDERAEKIINAFMPGALTIVLKRNNNIPNFICNGNDTIALRMATSKELGNLILEVGEPLYMTSANQSGSPVCTSLNEIEASCPLLDAMMEGSVIYGVSSTILDASKEELSVLRDGPIKLEEILNKITN